MLSKTSTILQWDWYARAILFVLASTSIWCLLAEFYGLCSMRVFTLEVLIPATLALVALAVASRVTGDRTIWNAVIVGAGAGLIAACAYDLFRLPFVFSREWGLAGIVPPMNLFKVFPRFGAMILGEPVDQLNHSLAAHLIGWLYHFSNGMTFGIMYVALIGDAWRRSWLWAVVMAVGLELAMLATPYSQFFDIRVNALFVIVTLTAHVVFGIALGITTKQWSALWFQRSPA